MSNCKNCNHLLSEHDHFCSQCGQKKDAHLLTVKELLVNFWSSIFNLDSTLFKTLKYLWAPWKLTRLYVEGKRMSMFNPMRLFLVTLLFHFGILVSLTNIDNNSIKSNEEYRKLERSELFKKFKAEKSINANDNRLIAFSDTIEKRLFKDTYLPENDTIISYKIFKKYPITRKDAIELPIDTIYRKYNITSFTEKIAVKQFIKINLDRAGTLKYALGNAAWGILVAILFLAGFFKILYRRQKKYFVEHLVFWMNVHSFSFVVVTILIFIFIKFFPMEESSFPVLSITATILLPLWLYISMYRYYEQSKLKTFLKFLLASFFYILVGLFVVLIVSLVSLLIF